jgi:hypothetical protein
MKAKRARGMVEHFLSKLVALSSNPSTTTAKKQKQKKRGRLHFHKKFKNTKIHKATVCILQEILSI